MPRPDQSEMESILQEADALCCSRRWWDAAVLFDILKMRLSDLTNWLSKVGQRAYASAVCDEEAGKHLDAAIAGLRDGRVDRADLTELRLARRQIARSAKLDRAVAEELTN